MRLSRKLEEYLWGSLKSDRPLQQLIRIAKVQRILLDQIYEKGFPSIESTEDLDYVIGILADEDAYGDPWMAYAAIGGYRKTIFDRLKLFHSGTPINHLGWTIMYSIDLVDRFKYTTACFLGDQLGRCCNTLMSNTTEDDEGYAMAMNLLENV